MTERQVTLTLDVPDGYEVVDYRVPQQHEWILDRPEIAIEVDLTGWTSSRIILRKIPSATVTVELPRETAEWVARRPGTWDEMPQVAIDACRAALEAQQ